MKAGKFAFLCGILAPFVAHASNEGVPSYYRTNETQNANKTLYGQYARQGYTNYVGQSGDRQIVNSRSTTYQIPRPQAPEESEMVTMMTANGIAMPVEDRTTVYAM